MIPNTLFKNIQRSARHLTYNSSLYHWSLKGRVPERLLVKPVDPWAGDPEAARMFQQSVFLYHEEGFELRRSCWEPVGAEQAWLAHMHGFTWLRDLRALGGNQARLQARALVEDWITHYSSWKKDIWRADITGERIALWIGLYESFGASASDEFQDQFFQSLICQARHLSRVLYRDKSDRLSRLNSVSLLKAAKGLLYAGLGFEGHEDWVEQALDIFEAEIKVQILADGAHISRSPAQLLEALQIMIDVRAALAAGGYPVLPDVQEAIERMAQAVRFFRYPDKGFALFNGAQEGDEALIEAIIAQAGVKSRKLQSLPCAGYERVTQGRTSLILDCGAPPLAPYDQSAHAAPLAFEMTYGKERLFTSCGTHYAQENMREALRATAAHNTVTINHRNACEIRADGHFERRAERVTSSRQDLGHACLLEASHDGYMGLYGLTHTRRLYLSAAGHDLRGEDSFKAFGAPESPLHVAIRFHLHPRVLVSLVHEGDEALLRLPTGVGWRFSCSSGILALDDTIYAGQGVSLRKSKQLVIYGEMSSSAAMIKWSLQREG